MPHGTLGSDRVKKKFFLTNIVIFHPLGHLNDDSVNPLWSISEPHVDLPLNEDTVVSSLVVSSSPSVL